MKHDGMCCEENKEKGVYELQPKLPQNWGFSKKVFIPQQLTHANIFFLLLNNALYCFIC